MQFRICSRVKTHENSVPRYPITHQILKCNTPVIDLVTRSLDTDKHLFPWSIITSQGQVQLKVPMKSEGTGFSNAFMEHTLNK